MKIKMTPAAIAKARKARECDTQLTPWRCVVCGDVITRPGTNQHCKCTKELK